MTDDAIIETRLTGAATLDEVRRWKELLAGALRDLPDGARFKLIDDLRSYEPANLDAHKEMRVVMPLTLAAHGFRTSLLDLFEGADLPLTTSRDVACVAVAHVHHDASKMEEYDRRIGRAAERFFTDIDAARTWIRTV